MTKETLTAIFQKYLENTCTPEEFHQMLEALSDPTLDDASKELIRTQLETEQQEAVDQEILDAGLSAILQKINPPFQWKRWLAAAAVLALVATGLYFWQDKSSSPMVAVPIVKDIVPGKQGAILTLADGSSVQLDSLGNGLIATQGNSKVLLQKGGVTYTPSNEKEATVQYNSMRTPRARQFQLTLADGTKVWLNAASSIKYPTAFNDSSREVEITGEVYFEVAHNARQPFIVKYAAGKVEVIGTHFNINAYPDEPVASTTLLEGRVKVTAATTRLMGPGEQVSVNSKGEIKVNADISTEEVMAWKNGKIALSNASLEEIMRQISRWYDIDIRYNGQLPDKQFNGIINREVNLSSVISVLEEYGIKCQLQGNTLVIL